MNELINKFWQNQIARGVKPQPVWLITNGKYSLGWSVSKKAAQRQADSYDPSHHGQLTLVCKSYNG